MKKMTIQDAIDIIKRQIQNNASSVGVTIAEDDVVRLRLAQTDFEKIRDSASNKGDLLVPDELSKQIKKTFYTAEIIHEISEGVSVWKKNRDNKNGNKEQKEREKTNKEVSYSNKKRNIFLVTLILVCIIATVILVVLDVTGHFDYGNELSVVLDGLGLLSALVPEAIKRISDRKKDDIGVSKTAEITNLEAKIKKLNERFEQSLEAIKNSEDTKKIQELQQENQELKLTINKLETQFEKLRSEKNAEILSGRKEGKNLKHKVAAAERAIFILDIIGITLYYVGAILGTFWMVYFNLNAFIPSSSGCVWIAVLSILAFVAVLELACIIIGKLKKIFSFYDVCIMCLSAICFLIIIGISFGFGKVKIYDYAYDGVLYDLQADGTLAASNAEYRVKSVTIPYEIKGHRVTFIEENAFDYCPKLKYLTIEAGLSSNKNIPADGVDSVVWDCSKFEDDAEALFIAGDYYGSHMSYKRAVELYEKSAKLGSASAQYHLGWCYDQGNGVAQNYMKAVEWYAKSAAQGNSNAQNNLGSCYYHGNGIAQNYMKAVEWYEKSAEQGNAAAQFNLGQCYKYGKGVEQDYKKAVEWYEKSAEQGIAIAQYNLGRCYEYGEGVAQDYKKAAEWYEKSAEQGDASAQYKIGYCYYYGKGVEKDDEKAIEWLEKSVAQGNISAASLLGTIADNKNN